MLPSGGRSGITRAHSKAAAAQLQRHALLASLRPCSSSSSSSKSGAVAAHAAAIVKPPARRRTVAARAQGGRSPRSTVSEASSDKARQPKPPSALSAAAPDREPQRHNPADDDTRQQQQQQQQHEQQQQEKDGRAWWHERRRERQRAAGMTRLEEIMRDTPVLDRFVDGALVLGDIVMVVATEVASDRVPPQSLACLAGVAAASWVLAGAALGDYKAEPDPDANPLSNMLGWPVIVAVANACVTWAAAMVPSMLGFSLLVSNGIVDADVVVEVARDGVLSPQLEVSVALLVTMLCWRGMAARLRLKADD